MSIADDLSRLAAGYASVDDKVVALNYVQVLRSMSEYVQAVAILQRLSIKFPRDAVDLRIGHDIFRRPFPREVEIALFRIAQEAIGR